MGANPSMGNCFDGYGYFTSVGLLLIGLLLWILSGVKAAELSISRKLIFVIATMLLAGALLMNLFLFPFCSNYIIDKWSAKFCCTNFLFSKRIVMTLF
jgi:hypothetical protein